MKNTIKKILAMVCCLALGVSAIAVTAIPAAADGEYFTITENNRNLFVNVDQEIALADIAVSINGVSLPGNDVIWTSSNAEVLIGGGNMTVTAKGIYTVDVEDADGNYGTVTIIAKNADETEYVLYEEDFESVANGTLPEGWSTFKNADVDEAQKASIPTYVDEPQVKDGVLYVGNGANNNYTYVWLPEFLDSFGDYRVTVDMAQSWVVNNMRLGGVVLRGDRTATDGAHPLGGYRLFVRRASTSGDGLRLTSLARIDNAANKNDAALPFYIGSVRSWSRPDCTETHWDPNQQPSPWYKPAESVDPDWKGEGYDVTYEVTTSGSNFNLDVYKTSEQEQFGGDMGPGGGGAWWETYWLKDDPALEGYEMSVNTENWDAVDLRETGAIGLFSSGVQLAVESIKVTVPANILAGNPDMYVKTELDPSLAVYQDQKIGVLSDIHLQTGSTAADYALKAALTSMKEQGVSAILFTGDMVNTGVAEEYEKLISIWDSVFPDAASAPKRLTITGNHEHEGVYFRGLTLDDTYATYLDAFGYDQANFHEVVNGIHIIGINSESHVVDGAYTLETVAYLEAELAAAAAADPYAPIIVMCHQTLANTTYGSSWGSSGTASLYEALRYYPQVVYLAGHSHFDFTNEKSIMQKDFTCVDVPSMQYTTVETGSGGTEPATYVYQNYLILDIDGTAKTLDIQRMKSYETNADTHAYETVQVKEPWTLNMPISKKNFTYTAARADGRVAPTFAADAEVSVSNITSSSVSIQFPAASHEDYVHAYNVVVTDAAGEALVSKYFVSDFYVLGEQKTEYTLDLTGLPCNTKVIVNVTAMESFGKVSEPITGEATTAPITTPSDGKNVADFFDVNTAVGFQDNSDYRRPFEVFNKAHPIKLYQDEEIGRQVAHLGGWINYPTSMGSLKEIADAFSMELVFKTPKDTAGDAEQRITGTLYGGGITVIFAPATGTLKAGPFIGPAHQAVEATGLTLDTWYHMVLTYDGANVILYLNGEKVGEVAATGEVDFKNTWITLGACTNAAGNAAYTYQGGLSVARIYTNVLDAADVAAAMADVENDNYINKLYQKWLALYNVQAAVTGAEDAAAVEDLMNKIDLALNSSALTEDIANEYIDEANELLIDMMKYDAKAPLAQFEDPLDDFSKVNTSSAYAGLQWENNTEIKKTLVSKQNNDDNYFLTYKLPGNVTEIQLDALEVSVYDKSYMADDFTFFVSKDGEEWVEVAFTSSELKANAVTPYWNEATLTGLVDGEYNYVKIQLNTFGMALDENGADTQRVNWATVMDGVRIWYADEGLEIPDAPIDPEDPIEPIDPEDPDKPDDSDKPDEGDKLGDSLVGVAVAAILMVLAAAAAFITSKKRSYN